MKKVLLKDLKWFGLIDNTSSMFAQVWFRGVLFEIEKSLSDKHYYVRKINYETDTLKLSPDRRKEQRRFRYFRSVAHWIGKVSTKRKK